MVMSCGIKYPERQFLRPGAFMLELEPILGYLNFSEGRPDPRFQRQWNDAYAHFADASAPWIDLRQALEKGLADLKRAGKTAFAQSVQAESALRLAIEHVVPAYRTHHRD